MTWLASAQALLAAGAGAALSTPLARQVIAPGSGFARDCRMLAVYPELVEAVPLPAGDLPGFGCAVVPALVLHAVFVADCVPTPSDDGSPPPAADVTAWTEAFIADTEAVWNAVADAALGGTLGDCSSVTIQQARVVGPSGGVAQFDVPVRLLSL